MICKPQTSWLRDSLTADGKRFALSDLGNAERLVAAHGDDLRHVLAKRSWFTWDGIRWAADDTGEVKRRAKATVRGILFEAAETEDDKHRHEIIEHEKRSESEHAIRAMMSLAEFDERIAMRLAEFDARALLFNVKNGTIDLSTREFREHRREDLLTKMSPVQFNRDAIAPTWERFLDEVTERDEERIRFLRRATGYSLTGNVTEHAFFLLFGTGANGKSTFLEVLRFVLGDYAVQADFSTFLATKSNAARNDLARLEGARFVSAIESAPGQRMAENIIKHMTGGDTVTARFLYREHFEFKPQFKLWLATNQKPKIIETDEAIWRRVKLFPFSATIPPENRDHQLLEKLKAEGSGILNWALAGLGDWQAHGLAEPEAVRQATLDYRQHEDVLSHFFDAKLNVHPQAETRASEMYRAYKDWTEAAGEFRLNEREFTTVLRDRGFVHRRNTAGRYWKGVKLKP
jgi:putative DNA primase/helicase